MDIREIPIVGGFAGAGIGAVDLLIHGGDLLFGMGFFIIGSSDLLLPMLTTLSSLASRVEWLPQSIIEQLVTVMLVVVIASYLVRLVRRHRATDNNE